MKERCRQLLNENNISHAFFHAPLDDAEFGTGASLANALNLSNCVKAILYEGTYYAGIIGEFNEPVEFEQLAADLSDILCEPIRAFKNNSNQVRKICVATGAGNMTNDIKVAVDNGCDAYITGEYNLYSQQYSKFAGISLLVGSHTNTEAPGVSALVNKLIEGTGIEAVRLMEDNY